jgi:hypothetical protein
MSYTNFPTIKTGGWAFQDPITNDQISQIQEYLLKCPNFIDGGAYAPSAPVVVGDSKITSVGIHVPYRILSDVVISAVISTPNNTSSYIDVTGCSAALADCLIGDIIEGVVLLSPYGGNAAGTGTLDVITKDTSGTAIDHFFMPFVGLSPVKTLIPFRSVCPVNGNLAVDVRIAGNGTYSAGVSNYYSAGVNHCIYCKWIRPVV